MSQYVDPPNNCQQTNLQDHGYICFFAAKDQTHAADTTTHKDEKLYIFCSNREQKTIQRGSHCGLLLLFYYRYYHCITCFHVVDVVVLVSPHCQMNLKYDTIPCRDLEEKRGRATFSTMARALRLPISRENICGIDWRAVVSYIFNDRATPAAECDSLGISAAWAAGRWNFKNDSEKWNFKKELLHLKIYQINRNSYLEKKVSVYNQTFFKVRRKT